MLKNFVKTYKSQKSKADAMKMLLDADKNFYQSCHGDFAYYPDYFYNIEKADKSNSGTLINSYRQPVVA